MQGDGALSEGEPEAPWWRGSGARRDGPPLAQTAVLAWATAPRGLGAETRLSPWNGSAGQPAGLRMASSESTWPEECELRSAEVQRGARLDVLFARLQEDAAARPRRRRAEEARLILRGLSGSREEQRARLELLAGEDYRGARESLSVRERIDRSVSAGRPADWTASAEAVAAARADVPLGSSQERTRGGGEARAGRGSSSLSNPKRRPPR